MFTVKQLSRIAGITPRTLHYYDEIGLLKPAQVGENGYRYYGQEDLLRLQQILLYRALDLPLEQIRTLLDRRGFAVLPALEQHRADLRKRITQLERLITTVDNTIQHLQGAKEMDHKQFFEGFSEEEQAQYQQEAEQMYDPETVKASAKKWKTYSAAEKQHIQDEGNAVYADLLAALPHGPASPEAQAGVERWRRHLEFFWTPRLNQLTGLADLYNDDPRFKANFDKIDPRMAEFLREAVKVYVAKQK